MKIYELKEGIQKNAVSIYSANKKMFEDIRNGKDVAFKYKNFFYKVVKGISIFVECENCTFKGKGHEMFCNNLGICLQGLIKDLRNSKKHNLNVEIRMAEEYEIAFMEE